MKIIIELQIFILANLQPYQLSMSNQSHIVKIYNVNYIIIVPFYFYENLL